MSLGGRTRSACGTLQAFSRCERLGSGERGSHRPCPAWVWRRARSGHEPSVPTHCPFGPGLHPPCSRVIGGKPRSHRSRQPWSQSSPCRSPCPPAAAPGPDAVACAPSVWLRGRQPGTRFSVLSHGTPLPPCSNSQGAVQALLCVPRWSSWHIA